MRKLDREGIAALFDAAALYHEKHSRGPGAAAICICGAGGGGSKACRGLKLLRDLFEFADLDDPKWRQRFEFIQGMFNR